MVIFLVLNNNSGLAWLAPRPCSKRLVQAVVFCLQIVLHFLTALSSSSSSSNVESLFSGGKWMTMWAHLRPKNKVCTFWYRYYYSWVNNRVTHCINCYSAALFTRTLVIISIWYTTILNSAWTKINFKVGNMYTFRDLSEISRGKGGGILNLVLEMRWPIPAMGVKFANPPLDLGLKYHNPPPLV